MAVTGDIGDFGCKAAEKWSTVYEQHFEDIQAIEEKRCGWQQTLAFAVGTFGYIQQYLLNQRMVDLAERGVDLAEDQYDLALRNYEEVVLNAYEKSAGYFMGCVDDMKVYIRKFLECGLGPDNEAPEVDYDLEEGRACAGVVATFDKARSNLAGRFGKYRVGALKDASIRLDTAQALAKVDATNKAYRYAESRQDRYEERAWGRKQAAAQMAYNVSSLSMNGLHQGVSGTISGVGAANNSLGSVLQAQRGASEAFQNLGNFWGSIANGAFQFAGYGSYQSPFSSFYGGLGNAGPGGAVSGGGAGGLLGGGVSASSPVLSAVDTFFGSGQGGGIGVISDTDLL